MKMLEPLATPAYTASTHEVIHLAQVEASRLHDDFVEPEHLFLALVRQGDEQVLQVLHSLGFTMEHIRHRIAEVFADLRTAFHLKDTLPLSHQSYVCLDVARALANDMYVSQVLPIHVLFASMRHERLQPLLVLLEPNEGALPTFLVHTSGSRYTAAVDQFIRSYFRRQAYVIADRTGTAKVLTLYERPALLFRDILGLDTAKHALFRQVRFLRNPSRMHPSQTYIKGIVLRGYPSSERTWLVRALAGEAVVPLLVLSFSTLVLLLHALEQGVLLVEEAHLAGPEYALFQEADDTITRGRRMLHHMFAQAKQASPCVLLLDDVDALHRLATSQEYHQWQQQLFIEMDSLDTHPQMVVVATTHRLEGVAQTLLYTHRFLTQVQVGSGFISEQATPAKFCHGCTREVMEGWKYCVYCGAQVARLCPICQGLQIEVVEARFCPDCGSEWSDRISQTV